jgi:hypothetical protein
MLHTLLRKIASGASVVALSSGMLDGTLQKHPMIELGWVMQQLLRVGFHCSVALRLDCEFDAEGFQSVNILLLGVWGHVPEPSVPCGSS